LSRLLEWRQLLAIVKPDRTIVTSLREDIARITHTALGVLLAASAALLLIACVNLANLPVLHTNVDRLMEQNGSGST
jgi:hypothetical protein